MVSINRSFIYGICFASITWFISLYLYMKMTTDEARTTLAPLPSLQIQSEAAAAKSQDLYSLGLVKSVEDQKRKDEGYKNHAYNVLISEQLRYHRVIPDTRNALCKNQTYSSDLPTASIIICFYNEHYQTLLRAIHSIVDRTPSNLLEEILLIDDYSDLKSLHSDLSTYISSNFKKVVLFKTERREGLIRARLFGSRRATGDVIIFLDSHVEVNTGWIEPLLDRIKTNRTCVVTPIIDIINADTFAYSASPLVRGGFNWGLHFKWENLPKGTLTDKVDFIKPIISPTMAGGLFAINRKYFLELGEYDAGMNIWGGENLEISFRVWMCGGRLEIIPCSRVGHVFRQRRPYGAPDGQDTMLFNSLRVANVWMDGYKDYFLNQRPDAKSVSYGDITSRLQLRKELKCYDFDWYLKNIYPELALPTDNDERLRKKWSALESDKFMPWHLRKRNYINQFQIRLSNTSLCLQSAKDTKTKGSNLILRPCLKTKNQFWYETDKQELVLAQLLCLQANKPKPILYKCHEMGGDQEWHHKGNKNSPIYNVAAGTCLGAKSATVNSLATMKLCSDSEHIIWDIVE